MGGRLCGAIYLNPALNSNPNTSPYTSAAATASLHLLPASLLDLNRTQTLDLALTITLSQTLARTPPPPPPPPASAASSLRASSTISSNASRCT